MAAGLRVVRTVKALRSAIAGFRSRKTGVALVPTMGALHDGHISLVQLARRRAARTVVSIFVNPAQFAPHEDFGRYPRTWKADIAALRAEKADLVFAPEVAELYPDGFATRIAPQGPALAGLEDKFRPHFFGGVATVVAKLLLAAMPAIAIFGEKDYQQLLAQRLPHARRAKGSARPLSHAAGKCRRHRRGRPVGRGDGARKGGDRARRIRDRLFRGASRRNACPHRLAERRANPAPRRGEARYDAPDRQSRRRHQAGLK
jgi:hypothetical protein